MIAEDKYLSELMVVFLGSVPGEAAASRLLELNSLPAGTAVGPIIEADGTAWLSERVRMDGP